jgi:hypothetical protein
MSQPPPPTGYPHIHSLSRSRCHPHQPATEAKEVRMARHDHRRRLVVWNWCRRDGVGQHSYHRNTCCNHHCDEESGECRTNRDRAR